jgi:hypothetical protein
MRSLLVQSCSFFAGVTKSVPVLRAFLSHHWDNHLVAFVDLNNRRTKLKKNRQANVLSVMDYAAGLIDYQNGQHWQLLNTARDAVTGLPSLPGQLNLALLSLAVKIKLYTYDCFMHTMRVYLTALKAKRGSSFYNR